MAEPFFLTCKQHFRSSLMPISVLVADDHEVVRTGLRSIFGGSEIKIAGEAASGEEVLTLTRELQPDILLMDIRLPPTSGIAVLEQIRAELPAQNVVMFSTYDNPTYVARSIALGAKDYLLKGLSRTDLIDAIVRVASGKSPSEGSIMAKIQGQMERRRTPTENDIPLTAREMQVLRHVALGLSNREIGRSLKISIETVKEHVQNILRKVDVTDRTQAAVWAVKRNIV